MTTTYNDKFCSACGNGLIHSAVVCPRCGSPVTQVNSQPLASAKPIKSKVTAVVLAVVFGPWSWLYTFSRNKGKFFLALPFQLVSLYFQVAVMAITLNDAVRGYGQDYRYSLFSSVVTLFTVFPFWLWAVIYYSTKPREFFENYSRKPIAKPQETWS